MKPENRHWCQHPDKRNNRGTISDLDGNFILPGVNPGDTLVISFVGYQPQEIPAAPTLQILLKEDSERFK